MNKYYHFLSGKQNLALLDYVAPKNLKKSAIFHQKTPAFRPVFEQRKFCLRWTNKPSYRQIK